MINPNLQTLPSGKLYCALNRRCGECDCCDNCPIDVRLEHLSKLGEARRMIIEAEAYEKRYERLVKNREELEQLYR